MKTTHRIRNSTHPTQVAQCSVVAVVDNNVESVPVYLTKKCMPPQHEMAVHVETINAPAKTTAALIEPRIVTAKDVHSPDVPKAFHRLVLHELFAIGQLSIKPPWCKQLTRQIVVYSLKGTLC